MTSHGYAQVWLAQASPWVACAFLESVRGIAVVFLASADFLDRKLPLEQRGKGECVDMTALHTSVSLSFSRLLS